MSVAEKLTEIAENVPKVFEAGVAQGYETGYREGAQKAPMTDNDLFWHRYQDNGMRTNYDYAFSTRAYVSHPEFFWRTSEVKPKYPMYVTSADHMFYNLQGDYKELDLTQLGHELAFTGCKNLAYAFAKTSSIRHVGIIDASKAKDVQRLFFECTGLEKVDRLVVHKGLTWTGAFSACMSLENITIEGEIGHRVQFHRNMSSLSGSSIISIINALSDDVTEDNIGGEVVEPSVYFSSSNIEKVFGSVDSPTWLALVDSKPNWNFVLA